MKMDLESYEVSAVVLEERALPALTTSTEETTAKQTSTNTDDDKTTSTSTSTSTGTSSKNTKLPSLTTKTTDGSTLTTSTGTSSTETASYTTPVMELPSAKGNPNIWSSNKPTGTVFIAVGSAAGFIFLALLVWFIINTWMSYSQAKQLKKFNNMEKQFQNPFIDDIDFSSGGGYYKADEDISTYKDTPVPTKNGGNNSFTPYKRASHSMIRLLGGSTDDGFGGGTPSSIGNTNLGSMNPLERVDAIDAANTGVRKSLYISPTMEVMNQQRRSTLFNNLNQSAVSIDTPEMMEPTRTVSPERRTYKHEKSKSSLSKLVDSTIDLTASTTLDNQKRQGRSKGHNKSSSITPSVYLDNMLEDNS